MQQWAGPGNGAVLAAQGLTSACEISFYVVCIHHRPNPICTRNATKKAIAAMACMIRAFLATRFFLTACSIHRPQQNERTRIRNAAMPVISIFSDTRERKDKKYAVAADEKEKVYYCDNGKDKEQEKQLLDTVHDRYPLSLLYYIRVYQCDCCSMESLAKRYVRLELRFRIARLRQVWAMSSTMWVESKMVRSPARFDKRLRNGYHR